jgi:hypothetical protein
MARWSLHSKQQRSVVMIGVGRDHGGEPAASHESIEPFSVPRDRVGRSAREKVDRIGEEVVGLVGVGSAGGNERGDALQSGNQQ